MAVFDDAFGYVVSPTVEGGYSDDPEDPGNWTGGKVGHGELRGTKYGISAARYPGEDIRGLTMQRAKDLYRRDYWLPCKCDVLPPAVALLVFDAAVNQGTGDARRFLQRAVGVTDDGVIGPVTLGAVRAANRAELIIAYTAERLLDYTKAGGWPRYGKGWSRRAVRTAIAADAMLGVYA